MNTHVRRSCIALALAGALFSAQAGAFGASTYDDVSPPQNITVFDLAGTITEYTFADPELVAVAEPDGMVTIYEPAPSLSDANEFTVHIPDGTGWAYVPSVFVTPEEAALINAALDDESTAPVYVASYVSPPEYRVTMEQ